VARGLLESDDGYSICLLEAASYQTGGQVRHLFAMIVIHNQPADIPGPYLAHYKDLSDDCRHTLIHRCGIAEPTDEQISDRYLLELQRIFSSHDLTLDALGLPLPSPNAVLETVPRLIVEESSYDIAQLEQTVDDGLKKANVEQASVYNKVM
jgi:hypothetical protein